MRPLTRPFLALFLSAVAATGQDPAKSATPTRVFFDVPGGEISRVMNERPGTTLEALVDQILGRIRKRLGEQTKVERVSATQFAVYLGDEHEVEAVRRRIEVAGTLEMRVLATDDYVGRDGRKPFHLAKEKERLLAWLGQGGREQVLRDPRAIDRFLGDPKTGPIAGKELCWFVHEIRPKRPDAWNYCGAQNGMTSAVLISDPADYDNGRIPERVQKKPADQQRLIELIAVNLCEDHFDNGDLDPSGIAAQLGPDGIPCVHYKLRANRTSDYADWSQKHIGHQIAILLDGKVMSMPRFESRIPGQGMIHGDFTKTEAEALAFTLKVDPVPITPVFLRQEPPRR
jgi:hypothetical protein